MNEIFNFHGQEVRTLTIDNEPWFVGKDVADILGYSKARNAIALHVDEEDALKQGIPTSGGTQDMLIINESGLYSLILSSKLPQAKEFKRWVTSEVLPAIRKQGGFIREDLDEDAFIALFTGQKKLREQQATMLEDIDYLKSEQPIHPSYAQSLLKKRKARVVACLGGIDSPAYADKTFAQSVFRQAEIDFKDHFNISRYDLLPKMDNVLLSLSEWIKSIIKDTITRLVEIEKDSDHYPELMDVNTTCEFLGIKYATFSDNYRYLKGFPKELPGKKWSKRAIKEWLSNQI
ncbi:gp15 [Streptococcus pneumoniae]|nr:gp15 [Streptococcus pneumoniae]